MSFKKAIPIVPKTYNETSEVFEWQETDKGPNFVCVSRNYQDEINKYQGQDLKSLISKNIIPNTDQEPQYIDETIYSNLDYSKLYNALNTEIVIDPETGEIVKNTEEVFSENKNTKFVDKDSSQSNNEIKSVPREKE